MPHNAQALLDDGRQAARLVEDFTTGRSLADYNTDAIVHGYNSIDNQIVWVVIHKELPVLK